MAKRSPLPTPKRSAVNGTAGKQTERPSIIHSSLYLPEPVYEALRKIAFDDGQGLWVGGDESSPQSSRSTSIAATNSSASASASSGWRWMSVSPTELAVRFIDGGEINYTRRDQEDD
jgi:hypothetical protein